MLCPPSPGSTSPKSRSPMLMDWWSMDRASGRMASLGLITLPWASACIVHCNHAVNQAPLLIVLENLIEDVFSPMVSCCFLLFYICAEVGSSSRLVMHEQIVLPMWNHIGLLVSVSFNIGQFDSAGALDSGSLLWISGQLHLWISMALEKCYRYLQVAFIAFLFWSRLF